MKIFLRLKHWQVFILIFLLISGHDTKLITYILKIFGAIIIYAWIITIAMYGNRKINTLYFQRDNKLFVKCTILLPIIVIINLCLPDNDNLFIVKAHIFPDIIAFTSGAIGTFAMFYVLYFTGQTITILNTLVGKRISLSVSLINACLLMMSPVGVWFIQPIVNKQLGDYYRNTGNA